MQLARLLAVAIGLSLVATPPTSASEDAWPAPVPGYQEPQPGEHPRLFFRKSDVPALREKAATPEGQKIVARLRELLGNNGESLPEFHDGVPVNLTADRTREGVFTYGHPAGYGLLYQLTGEKKYADLARQGLERMFNDELYEVSLLDIKKRLGKLFDQTTKGMKRKGLDQASDEELAAIKITYGQPDMDPRYNWTYPGSGMRAGAMFYCVALAYDLCYDAWDPAFREQVVREIVEYNKPTVFYQKYVDGSPMTFADTANAENYPPTSNHFGFTVGGAGIALAAIRNDPGVDNEMVDSLLEIVDKNTKRNLTEGFGNRAYYAEGQGAACTASNPTFIPWLQVARVALGKDYITPSEAAQWLTLRWPMTIVPAPNGQPWYPNLRPGPYGQMQFTQNGMTDGGEFAQGFGALANQEQVSATLWTYLNSIQKWQPDSFGVWHYPHKMVAALVNWPIGLEATNPSEVLPHATVDDRYKYYMFRKQWEGPDDILFTFLLNPDKHHGYVKGASGGSTSFWGLQVKGDFNFSPPWSAKDAGFETAKNGSGVLMLNADGERSCLAVDYSGTSGVPAVVLIANCWEPKNKKPLGMEAEWMERTKVSQKTPTKGKLVRKFLPDFADGSFLMMLGEGEMPTPQIEGDTLRLGGQTYKWDGERVVFATGD